MKDNSLERSIQPDRFLCSALLFIGFVTCVYAPYELYILNRDEFWFLFSVFWYIPVIVFITMFSAGYLIGVLLPTGLRRYYSAFLFAIGLCIYVQGNFLNIDVGIMNGAHIYWENYRLTMIIHLFVWVFIVAFVMIITKVKSFLVTKVGTYLSLGITAMLLLTLLFLFIQHRDQLFQPNREIAFLTEDGEYEMGSADGNIVFFVLDMFDDDYFKELLARESETLDCLDGFTYFANNTGSHSTTVNSMTEILTGKRFRNQMSLSEFANSFDDETLYLDELENIGYDLYFYPQEVIDLIPTRYYDDICNLDYGTQKIGNKLHFTLDVYQLVMCKYFPDIIKPYVWTDGTDFDKWERYGRDQKPSSMKNIVFWNGENSNPNVLDGNNDREFKFIYLEGTHYPYRVDAYLNEIEDSYDDPIATAEGCMRMVGKYIDRLKSAGLYDNTSIVITADHGVYWGADLTCPVFLVKPAHSRGQLVIDNAPVSQVDIPATVLQLAGDGNYEEYGLSAFDVPENSYRERFFYEHFLSEESSDIGTWRMVEYSIDPAGNSFDDFELTDVEYTPHGRVIKHSDYCMNCLGMIDIDETRIPDVRLWYHKKTEDYPE